MWLNAYASRIQNRPALVRKRDVCEGWNRAFSSREVNVIHDEPVRRLPGASGSTEWSNKNPIKSEPLLNYHPSAASHSSLSAAA